MADEIRQLSELLNRLERLLCRYELDMAARLHAIDYQAAIAMLCEQFDMQMRELAGTSTASDGVAYATARSTSYSFGISRTRSGGNS